jgi:hypothetical protein
VFKILVEQQSRVAAGFTKDMSATGVYICCEQSECPAVNKDVDIDILLPPIDREAAPRMRVRSTGRVTRLNSPQEASEFAVAASFGEEPA